MKLKTREIAITSLFVGIVALMTFTPIGLVPLGFLSLNIVLLPIIICAQTTNWKSALIVSTAFGIFSMINSYVRPVGLLYFAVQNPLVSILPRIFIGLITYFVFVSLNKRFSRKTVKKDAVDNNNIEENNNKVEYGKIYLASTISTVVGVLTNTIGFFVMLLVVFGGAIIENGSVINLPLILGIVVTNFIPELIVAVLVCPTTVIALKKALKR